MDISRLLRVAEDADDRPRLDPEVAVFRLREAAARFAAPVPFKVGDLVTVRRDAPLTGSGEPQIVIEVRPDADLDWAGEHGSWSFGSRNQVRALRFISGDICPCWVEAAHLEPWPLQNGEAS
jgi:hypothetical protein